MNENDIKENIRNYISDEYLDEEDAKNLTDESPLVSSGLIDSISILQVVDFLEQQFNFEFEPHEVDQANLNTINLMLKFIQSKKAS